MGVKPGLSHEGKSTYWEYLESVFRKIFGYKRGEVVLIIEANFVIYRRKNSKITIPPLGRLGGVMVSVLASVPKFCCSNQDEATDF
jgi:hypothetical protein